MIATRREFIGGAAALALGGQASGAWAAPASPAMAAALAAIGAHAQEHLRHFALPALTLSLTAPGGFATQMDFGHADPAERRRADASTLFQIGSISKVMTAVAIHQLAAEGRLRLGGDVRAVLPEAPLPQGVPITVQQLLDHVSGLPADAPAFPDGERLWTGFAPGQHWSYSNTGYTLLGLIAERIERRPLAQILHARLFAPLGMTRTRGAIVGADRARFAIGYGALDGDGPLLRGAALAPAPWVEVTFGAGSVASTASDMVLFMRSLFDAAQGRGGLGLDPERARAFVGHDVATEDQAMRYGNGLMKRVADGRALLHHTGGMVAFSSSFHLDPADGTGAFASASIGFPANYRPRALTLFAVQALQAAREGRTLPRAPSLHVPIPGAAYAGRYEGPGGGFEIKGADPVILAGGREAPLQMVDEDALGTLHPQLAAWPLRFIRRDGRVVAAGWGPETFVRQGTGYVPPASDPQLALLAGRYVSDSPWSGVARVAERSGQLWLGGVAPLTRLGVGLWRIGDKAWSPERARFANPVGGRPQTLLLSGDKFDRRDI